jgi:hypothetical protein
MKNLILFTLLLSLGSSQVFAAKRGQQKSWKKSWESMNWLTDTQVKAMKKQMKKGRHIAQAQELRATEEFTKAANMFLAAKSSSDIATLIKGMEKGFSTASSEVKMLGALFLRLKPFRGIVYRMVPLAEKSKIAHTKILTQVKGMLAGLQIYLPANHANAVFKFITEPYIGMEPQFKTLDKLQEFFLNDVYVNKLDIIKKIESIEVGNGIVWDNKMIFGSDSFKDDLERYSKIGELEKLLLLSKLHKGAHNILRFSAYKFPTKNFFKVIKKTAGLFGFDTIRMNVRGVSEEDRVQILKKYGTGMIKPIGGILVKKSFSHLSQSLKLAALAWAEAKVLTVNEFNLLNIAGIDLKDRQVKLSIDEVSSILNGETKISSKVDKDNVITVNLPALYDSPIENLTSLLPTKFEKGPRFHFIKNKKGKKIKKLKFRNYSKGRAIAWNVKAYKTLFPSMESESDLPRYKRALGQSYGGAVLNSPLAMFIK